MAEFPSIAHVAVTVSDLGRSVPWYERLFDAKPVLDEDTGPFHHVVWLLGPTLFGIHQHSEPESRDAFSELRPGLDHVGFGVASRAELEGWVKRLDELGITAESWMPPTAPGSRSATRTTSRSSSSRRRAELAMHTEPGVETCGRGVRDQGDRAKSLTFA